jgi:hypothetical protein
MTIIRQMVLSAIVIAGVLGPSAALAAPTCQTRAGEAVRCGIPGAMPVGWTLPYDQRPAATRTTDVLPPAQWFGLFALVGGLFAMIALMPPFDGRKSSDWGDEQPDGEDRD